MCLYFTYRGVGSYPRSKVNEPFIVMAGRGLPMRAALKHSLRAD